MEGCMDLSTLRQRLLDVRAVATAIGLVVLVSSGKASANGDEFFAFKSTTINPDGSRKLAEAGFFGSVKDEAGNYIDDATITVAVTVPSESGEPQRLMYDAYTNVLGRYRTLDPSGAASDLLEMEIKVAPEDVELLGVEKKGYKQLRRIDRSRRSQKKGMVEVDFIVTKDDSAAKPK